MLKKKPCHIFNTLDIGLDNLLTAHRVISIKCRDTINNHLPGMICVMVPSLQTIIDFSYYDEYWENIHLGVKLTPA